MNHRFVTISANILLLFWLTASIVPPVFAQKSSQQSYLYASSKDMQWWKAARFGMFIHWGPVSLKGTEIGWSRGGERRGMNGTGEIPVEVYDNLYKEFNPVKFDADAWVKTAKDAGMKYIVFTTKHHDGFSMFDSGLADYKITNSPFKRDVVKELADACHRERIRLGFYYSPVDWHHPDYRTENHARYIQYLHGQLHELCSRYGQVDILWFDGLQINPMTGSGGEAVYDPAWAKDWDSENLFREIRTLQPHVIINNRCGLKGDFDTPEQHVGFFQTSRPWESCITICRQWAWKPNDTMKSLRECIRTLVMCAGGDGNLLLNVGPMPTGEIEPRQAVRLKEMGAWLKKYGRAIYRTRGGPFPPAEWGVSTRRGATAYIHILNWESDTILLPPLSCKLVSHTVLTGGKAIVKKTAGGIEISVPKEDRNDIDTIVELRFSRRL
jgi:alpha-L-fucosidase